MMRIHAATKDEERAHVRTWIAALARAIDDGAVFPTRHELYVFLELCEQLRLQPEAARVRRWLGIPNAWTVMN